MEDIMKKTLVAGCMLFALSAQAGAVVVEDADANKCFKVAAKSTVKITRLYAKAMNHACKKGLEIDSVAVDELGTKLHRKLVKAQSMHNNRVNRLVCNDPQLPEVAGALNFMGLSLVDLNADGSMKDFTDGPHTADLINISLAACRPTII